MSSEMPGQAKERSWLYNHIGRLSGLALGLVFVALLVVLAANGYAPATSFLVVAVAGFLMISIGSMMRGGAR
jgi:hypothetical protein